MDTILILGIIAAVFMFIVTCLIAFFSIKKVSDDRANKKLFLNNSSQIKKGQSLDNVLKLLGRPTTYTEIDNKYVLKWEQTEERPFDSITRSITIVVNQNEKVIDVHRENMD